MAYLEITMQVPTGNRAAAEAVYRKYLQPFLDQVRGATAKVYLEREKDVQVLHTFDTTENAEAYLQSDLFTADVVTELGPLLAGDPDFRIYEAK
ncbi:hypothetical protein [Paraburkholderia sp. JHI869]|uniref:hypothetical protein n=1 Tax=Paraburkholderia sp. JHI869 TaxID=3112959 RepID=UPI00316B85A4